MTLSRVEAVQRAAESAVQRLALSACMATVTATHTDGTVDITTAAGPVPSVRRFKSYAAPAVGDVVLILKDPAGNWTVLGAYATS